MNKRFCRQTSRDELRRVKTKCVKAQQDLIFTDQIRRWQGSLACK